ncbi:hypothetical protein ASF99_15880 [Exiguobacterium sp. Leaf187]|jgi:rhodanese-related sulfurtransferase|uniref:Rhodanese domain-containing protein n=3 Tax=Exiguobacterium TaxID=33986 RepID=A0A0V8GGB7_9BACL|nr:hypothetical protein U719_04670 [Exiguobacterium sp. MH3]AOT00035.1 rhodanese-like domain-containing protein [Exiguobacterium sp. U13-1]KNH33986.1 hypothetical protein ACS74_11330 [Exiguobacterium acetylicum]KQS20443.1 hypothetical protein ASF99_15880 [Exiguobacterium sp. Leaf187]KSU49217.1 hypothetical protein AS033_07535 [Exiguobacterium enclense]KTR26841.1 hypothetical protein RSA11_08440 [Exiguobacterium indicum]MBF8153787.1 rhodanese-like domain-containing protein [Exiguobacterium sp.
METGTIITIVLWVALIAYIAWRFMPVKGITKLSQEEFRANYRKAQIVDVRETQEFKGGHIVGARNIPVSQMKMRSKELRKDMPIYLYCQGSMRSSQAAKVLKKAGYTNLYQLKGGFKQWSGKIKRS